MKEIIQRLRREKAEIEKEGRRESPEKTAKKAADYKAGKEAGIQWAKKAHYNELTRFKTTTGSAAGIINASLTDDIKKQHNSTIEWASAWLEGVQEFWSEIEGKL